VALAGRLTRTGRARVAGRRSAPAAGHPRARPRQVANARGGSTTLHPPAPRRTPIWTPPSPSGGSDDAPGASRTSSVSHTVSPSACGGRKPR
jgi:hypothetical protein